MYRKFKPLNIPDGWEQYWSKYPNGYSILEALIDWVSQVDDMVDNQNELTDTVKSFGERIDEFINQFGTELQQTVTDTLSEWQNSGFLDDVISEALQWELDNYITTNEQDKVAINEQLAQKATLIEDLSVNVRNFKNDSNSWEMALNEAIDYANTIKIAGSESGTGNYLGSNVTVKMPRGRYTFNAPLVDKNLQYINLDFKNCVLVSVAKNKTVDFFTNASVFRTTFIGGTYIGFKNVFQVSTGNTDTSKIIFDRPHFNGCYCGIDTVSYEASRSTYLEINDIMAKETDIAMNVHTDMCIVNGGWINNSATSEIASIINKGFLRIRDMIFVPKAATPTGLKSRYIDNYDGYAGDRGLVIEHCRFGQESGGLSHIVVNYADNYWYNRVPTKIKIADSMTYTRNGVILLEKMPNNIVFDNCTGNDGVLVVSAPTLDLSEIDPNRVSIDIDNATKGHIESGQVLFNNDELYKFVNTQYMTSNRFSNYPHTFNRKLPFTNGSDTFDIPLNLQTYPYNSDRGQAFGDSVANTGFFLSVSGRVSNNSAYNANCLYYVALSSGHGVHALAEFTEVHFTKILSTSGGSGFNIELTLDSINFNDTTDSHIRTALVDPSTFLRVKMSTTLSRAYMQVIPMAGLPINSYV